MGTSKTCTKCGDAKSITEFSKKGNRCLECNRANGRSWYYANHEKALASSAEWRKNNPEKSIASARARQESNPERTKETRRRSQSKRRALLKGVNASLNTREWKEVWDEFDGKCFWCEDDASGMDHIVPLTPRTGGLQGHHVKGNVVPACQPCNNRKNNKDPIVFLFELRDVI